MATKAKDRKVFLLPEIRLRHCNVFIVRPAFEEGQKEKFAATALLDPTVKKHKVVIESLGAEIRRLTKELGIDEILGKKVYNGFESKKFHLCMGKGEGQVDEDTDEIKDGFEGMIFLKATSKNRPLVVDRDLTILAESDGKVFAGVYGNMKIEFYTWKYKTGRVGIGANLRSFQYLKEGEPFGRGPLSPEDEFAPADSDDEGDTDTSWDE